MPYLLDLGNWLTCDQLNWLHKNFYEDIDFVIIPEYGFDEDSHETISIVSHIVKFNKESDAMMFTLSCL